MKRVNVYAVIREMREQIVNTMQELGITELATCMSYQDWGKEQGYSADDYAEDETDDDDYMDYKDQEAPYVIFFGKYGTGYDYRVDKVKLRTYRADNPMFNSGPVLEFDCHENELGDDSFQENDLVFLTLYNVYDTLFDLLHIEDEYNKKIMAQKKYAVTYKAGDYQFKDTWYAESEEEARRVASDDYKANLDDFKGIISVEEIYRR